MEYYVDIFKTDCVNFWGLLQNPDSFDYNENTPFMHYSYPLIGSLLYLPIIFLIKWFMANRTPNKGFLKVCSFIHNVNLTILSIAMLIGTAFFLFRKYEQVGFYHLICEISSINYWEGQLGFWIYIYHLSKYYELIDTWLLCFKKKSLLKLHVYHHLVMVSGTWMWLPLNNFMMGWVCTVLNSFIHSVMYIYYACADLGYSFWWKRHLTKLQIIQFITGLGFTITWFIFYNQDNCDAGQPWGQFYEQAVGFSFLFLFMSFYIESYLKKRSASKKKKEE
eukprot:TRINITY_DN16956_c0_g1_i1.p1 TRINITY_DN16956_c0_g1~~TRINITY_DN16956_c0_g1_i1.p1  ORF type:complete len:285 (+),score=90.14 TRINITY_DN16956_c0_g1_i1:24-857(+)